jgi:hypothetical protein
MSSSVPWRLREQARKDMAESEARRRATEKSEINFPSLSGTEWGAAPVITTSVAKKWMARSVVAATTTTLSSDSAAARPAATSSWTPPVIVSRANIARAISEYKYYDDSRSPVDEHKRTDDEWVEVRGRQRTHAAPASTTDSFKDYEYNHYLGDFDDTGVEDSRNS